MTSMSSDSSLGRVERVEVAGDLAGAELARPALPARLDVEEPRDHAGDREHVAGVVEHDEAGRPEPAAGGSETLVADRRVEVVAGEHWVRDARQHRLDRAAGRGPPPSVSMTSRSGVPGSISP